MEEVFDAKKAINEAFHFTKSSSPVVWSNRIFISYDLSFLKGDSKYGDAYLEFREFRLFLQTLRATFEFYQVCFISEFLSGWGTRDSHQNGTT